LGTQKRQPLRRVRQYELLWFDFDPVRLRARHRWAFFVRLLQVNKIEAPNRVAQLRFLRCKIRGERGASVESTSFSP